jgi:hypothetical protein
VMQVVHPARELVSKPRPLREGGYREVPPDFFGAGNLVNSGTGTFLETRLFLALLPGA